MQCFAGYGLRIPLPHDYVGPLDPTLGHVFGQVGTTATR